MENKLEPKDVLTERIFSDIVVGVYDHLRDVAGKEQNKISNDFQEMFDALPEVDKLKALVVQYNKIGQAKEDKAWYQSNEAFDMRLDHLLQEAYKVAKMNEYEVANYCRTPTPERVFSEFKSKMWKKIVLPEYPDRDIVRAKLRLVKDITSKSFSQLVKIANEEVKA